MDPQVIEGFGAEKHWLSPLNIFCVIQATDTVQPNGNLVSLRIDAIISRALLEVLSIEEP